MPAARAEVFLFSTLSLLAVEPTHSPTESVPVKRQRGETADHSHPPRAEIENSWSYTSIFHTPSWCGS
jgi:hypothetical protein